MNWKEMVGSMSVVSFKAFTQESSSEAEINKVPIRGANPRHNAKQIISEHKAFLKH
jgi:hypothetical protein